MLIHPLSKLICRGLFKRGNEAPNNPLKGAALESTIMMIGGLLTAALFLPVHAEFAFPVAAVAIGTRYGLFRSFFGNGLFWLLGAVIVAIGAAAIFQLVRSPSVPVYAVGAVEILFALLLISRNRRAPPLSN
jgi:hypothetical protein